jgi:two-component system, NtrC family, nitrogen regulation sensor histidine kinase NtrY
MPRRVSYSLAAILLVVSATVLIWQGSFPGNFGSISPEDPEQTFVFYGISIVIFLLMVTLGFMLLRLVLKLWIDRRADRPGSRIRTKLIFGALLLSLMPVFFMVFFSVYVLSATLQRWFSRPTEHELVSLTAIAVSLDRQTRAAARANAELLAASPGVKAALAPASRETLPALTQTALGQFCATHGVTAVGIYQPCSSGVPGCGPRIASWGVFPNAADRGFVMVTAPVELSGSSPGSVVLASAVPLDVRAEQTQIERFHHEFDQLSDQRKLIRQNGLQLLTLIAFFVLFVAMWLAQLLARQISGPISALLHAAEEVSRGNLSYRVNVSAMDELARLVDGFNRMTADLEANRAELEARRRFTEAILESIPTGVISIDSNGSIERVNKAFEEMFPDTSARAGARLDSVFSREDAAELRYLINRARRTGVVNRQLDIRSGQRNLHLGVTVAAIQGGRNSGFVVVIEDTSDLLRAQKTAAWSEVARRVAHEIRNPLTPITLSAERIIRQANRASLPPAMDKALRECASTILDETASVKRLVDEFSQFSRLPAARPVLCDVNDAVSSGLSVFEGRLDGIALQVELAPHLPQVLVDPEQIKRVVVNLVDNAAEAMADSPTRQLAVQTRAGETDAVEIIVADTGCGITAEQKEKLFLPYFSTKGRGTGLGLAIVSHILAEHNASIRVEDNKPCGATFTVEIPAAGAEDRIPVNGASVNA